MMLGARRRNGSLCTPLTDCGNAGEGGTLSATADLTCVACDTGKYVAAADNVCAVCAGTTADAAGTTANTDGGAVTCIFGTCDDTNGACYWWRDSCKRLRL